MPLPKGGVLFVILSDLNAETQKRNVSYYCTSAFLLILNNENHHVFLLRLPSPSGGVGGGSLFLHALQIRTVAGIHLYKVALIDEERHADFHASLQCCRLCSVCCGVALDAWF